MREDLIGTKRYYCDSDDHEIYVVECKSTGLNNHGVEILECYEYFDGNAPNTRHQKYMGVPKFEALHTSKDIPLIEQYHQISERYVEDLEHAHNYLERITKAYEEYLSEIPLGLLKEKYPEEFV